MAGIEKRKVKKTKPALIISPIGMNKKTSAAGIYEKKLEFRPRHLIVDSGKEAISPQRFPVSVLMKFCLCPLTQQRG